jgi:ribosomal protein S4
MAHLKKYKAFSKLQFFLFQFQTAYKKILKFKRSKWKRLKARLTSFTFLRLKRSFFINNFIYTFLKKKSSSRLKSAYKQSLILKRAFTFFFGNICSIKLFKKLFKKNLQYKDYVLSCLVKPMFNVYMVLWKSGFISSYNLIKQVVENGLILVNNKKITTNINLKEGDIINYQAIQTIITPNLILNSFLEFDLYSKKIYIIKNYKNFSVEDLYLLNRDCFNLKLFKDYIKSK